MAVPLGIPAVVTSKALEVVEIEDARVFGEERLELVDQIAVYVTGPVTADPSVFVVTAFQESVSACAAIDTARRTPANATVRRIRNVCMNFSLSWFRYDKFQTTGSEKSDLSPLTATDRMLT
jgi:hypothetical protein